MNGYTEHRTSTNGRLDLEHMELTNHSAAICISARENRRKDRGVDIRIFLDADDIVKAVLMIAASNDLLRLRLKSELVRMDYQDALRQAQKSD